MALTVSQIWSSSNQRVGVFFRLGITPPARIWLGAGDCEAGIDATDGDGATYSGLGQILDVPRFNQLVNGAAERVELSLSGVSSTVLTLASNGADEVRQAPLYLGIGLFDANWQLVAAPVWIRRFVVDFLSVEIQPDESGVLRTVKLSVRSFLTGRRRPALVYFSDHDQQTLSPGDHFCERTSLYTNTTQKVWPRF